jgi:hypothetical protein
MIGSARSAIENAADCASEIFLLHGNRGLRHGVQVRKTLAISLPFALRGPVAFLRIEAGENLKNFPKGRPELRLLERQYWAMVSRESHHGREHHPGPDS